MRHDPRSHDRRWPTISLPRGFQALAAQPARTVLAASLLLGTALPLASLAPSIAQAAVGPLTPNLTAVALDDSDPALTSPRLTPPAEGGAATARLGRWPDPPEPRPRRR